MQDLDLFAATVPVFKHYLGRISVLSDRASVTDLRLNLVPGAFCAGEHFVVAQGFVLRTVFPVIGRAVPELNCEAPTPDCLAMRTRDIRVMLDRIDPGDFDGAASRTIRHRAGEGDLEQGAADYVRIFGLPNFFFHFTMGYATLGHAGIDIGKADFDGLHQYPPGFRFER